MIATALALVGGTASGILLLARFLDRDRLHGPGFSIVYLATLALVYPVICAVNGQTALFQLHLALAGACLVIALTGFVFGFGPVIAAWFLHALVSVGVAVRDDPLSFGPSPLHAHLPGFAAAFAITFGVGLTLLTREDRSIR